MAGADQVETLGERLDAGAAATGDRRIDAAQVVPDGRLAGRRVDHAVGEIERLDVFRARFDAAAVEGGDGVDAAEKGAQHQADLAFGHRRRIQAGGGAARRRRRSAQAGRCGRSPGSFCRRNGPPGRNIERARPSRRFSRVWTVALSGCFFSVGGGIRPLRSFLIAVSQTLESFGTSSADIVSKATLPAQSVALWQLTQ